MKLVIAIALFVLTVAVAEARQCTTTCNTYGGQTTCNQTCW
jgi:hypothetical protein